MNIDVASENGATPGDYKVIISFLVNKNGSISDVQALNDPGYGTAAEAIRIIRKTPEGSWNAAIQNGNNVIYRQKQTITFEVRDNQ